MATPTDASFAADFNLDEMKAALLSTMQMGMPEAEAAGLTWHWNTVKTFTEPVSPTTSNPYDWTSTPATEEPGNPDEADGQLQVPYALQWSSRPAASKDTSLGQFDASRGEVYLFPEHYELIKDADYCMIHGDVYHMDIDAPPLALFTFEMNLIIITAEDES